MPKRSYICNPIIDWTDEDVWHFIKGKNLPYCELYDKGWSRLGCLGCPLAGEENQRRDFEAYPRFKEQYIRTFQKMLDKDRGGVVSERTRKFDSLFRRAGRDGLVDARSCIQKKTPR